MSRSGKFLSVFLLLLICFTTAPIMQTLGAIYSAPTGICKLQLVNIDGSSKLMQVHMVFEEATSPIFSKRSTSVIVWKELDYTYSAIIWGNDPEWQLLGTNDENVSHWQLEKDLYFQFNESSIYPFQEFKGSFYLASNMSHYFFITPLPNYLANVSSSRIDASRFPHDAYGSSFVDFNAQGIYDYNEIIVTASLGEAARATVSIFYVVSVVLSAALILLIWSLKWRKGQLSFTNLVTITTGVLFFLPILSLTFRTSIAPGYLTPVDWILFGLIVAYGLMLCVEIWTKIRRKKIDYAQTIE